VIHPTSLQCNAKKVNQSVFFHDTLGKNKNRQIFRLFSDLYSIINRTKTGPKTHSIFGTNIGVERIVVNQFEVVSTLALLGFTLNT
jgi:hypothetical protein